MNDREFLELAAKAAGRGSKWWMESVWNGPDKVWNPITDDGDAMRLMVRLRLHARQFPIVDDGFDVPLGMVEVWRVDDDAPLHVEFLRSGEDRLAATRRAIVRAAAEIGRQML